MSTRATAIARAWAANRPPGVALILPGSDPREEAPPCRRDGVLAHQDARGVLRSEVAPSVEVEECASRVLVDHGGTVRAIRRTPTQLDPRTSLGTPIAVSASASSKAMIPFDVGAESRCSEGWSHRPAAR